MGNIVKHKMVGRRMGWMCTNYIRMLHKLPKDTIFRLSKHVKSPLWLCCQIYCILCLPGSYILMYIAYTVSLVATSSDILHKPSPWWLHSQLYIGCTVSLVATSSDILHTLSPWWLHPQLYIACTVSLVATSSDILHTLSPLWLHPQLYIACTVSLVATSSDILHALSL